MVLNYWIVTVASCSASCQGGMDKYKNTPWCWIMMNHVNLGTISISCPHLTLVRDTWTQLICECVWYITVLLLREREKKDTQLRFKPKHFNIEVTLCNKITFLPILNTRVILEYFKYIINNSTNYIFNNNCFEKIVWYYNPFNSSVE